MGGANQAAVCVPACTQMDQAWMHAHSCPGNVTGCNEHLTTGTNPAHCSPVTYVSGHQRLSAMPKGSACVSCDTYFQCGPMYFAGNCGTALYQVRIVGVPQRPDNALGQYCKVWIRLNTPTEAGYASGTGF